MSPKYAKDQPTGFVNRIEKVAIVGAGGTIGSYFVRELLKTGKHTITALTRQDSASKLPEGVHPAPINYDDQASIVNALRGQQFLIITLGVRVPKDTEPKLIRAAAEAGVPYVMPNAYSPDPMNDAMLTDALVGLHFINARKEIEQLGVSSWVAFGCGFWYEWSLLGGGGDRFGCDVAKREMTFYGDGEEKITTTTWDQCGRALAAFLSLRLYPEDEGDKAPAVDNWANKVLYVSSFRVNQKDMFESVKRVTGTTDADWKIGYEKAEDRFKKGHEAMKNGDMSGYARQMYARIFYPTGEGDHARLGLADETLGLPHEDIDEVTKEGLQLLEQGKLSYH
ncbi:Bifunctional pinoresinol-lariciresinol reductase [Cytospora mali]|uniref:Bifunctional pinoresinol-lariciresinol reductase n=1 Tax=Cytospora mali TaxID=578113 RepID=A0A194W8W0_CYTMA|nr:Bifunctional pinoresinol-lariciresinol reductase [Valsa mali]